MNEIDCHTIVFSSSATNYDTPVCLPYDESHSTKPINEHRRTHSQRSVRRQSESEGVFAALLQLSGVHVSGQITENPKGVPTNLKPYLAEISGGIWLALTTFGYNFYWRGGTAKHDYVYVVDLERGASRNN